MVLSGSKPKVYNLSVSKALIIINLLADNEEPLSLKRISELLGLSPSTAHHIISVLKQERFVDQNQSTKKYGIGLRLYEIGLSKNYYQLLVKKAVPTNGPYWLIPRRNGVASTCAGRSCQACQKQIKASSIHTVRLMWRMPRRE